MTLTCLARAFCHHVATEKWGCLRERRYEKIRLFSVGLIFTCGEYWEVKRVHTVPICETADSVVWIHKSGYITRWIIIIICRFAWLVSLKLLFYEGEIEIANTHQLTCVASVVCVAVECLQVGDGGYTRMCNIRYMYLKWVPDSIVSGRQCWFNEVTLNAMLLNQCGALVKPFNRFC